MKTLKRFLLLVAVAFLLISMTAYGLDPLSLKLEGFRYDNGTMEIFFNTSLDQEIQPDRLNLTLGNEQLGVSDLKRMNAAEKGVSYLFLVDVSGSMSDEKLKAVKQILTSTLEDITEKDNVSIFSVGNDAYANPFVSTLNEYRSQIDAIDRKPTEDTNLYASIVKGLDVLKTGDKVNDKKCMVVLSDGEDDYTTGITQDEVYKKIESCHIPVFTIAMMEKKPTQKKVDASKTLGSFARSSPGGLDLVYGLDETTSSNLASKINTAIDNGYVLTADLSHYVSGGKEQVLKLELKTETGSTSDSYTIETNGFTGTAPSSPTPEAGTPDEKEADESAEEQSGNLWLIWVLSGAVVVIAVILIVLSKSRKKKVQVEAPQADPSENMPLPEKEQAETASVTASIPAGGSDTLAMSQPEPLDPDVTVVLTKMDRLNNQVYMVDIFGSIVVGRVQEKSDLAFPEDGKLSSAHCQISFSANKLYVKDLNSTNGTYVNGIPISGQYKLEKGDILQMGSLQFRVNW